MEKPSLTVALIGHEHWGPNLLRNYFELPDVKVKWVCDRDAGKLGKAKKRYPSVLVSESYGDVLGDPEVDAVVIATPISTHFALADADTAQDDRFGRTAAEPQVGLRLHVACVAGLQLRIGRGAHAHVEQHAAQEFVLAAYRRRRAR